MARFDLAIVGAGPAGMAAAATAAGQGLRVALLDEQPQPGGQIYRAVDSASPARAAILGADYLAGRRLTAALDHPGITHLRGAVVWSLMPGYVLSYSRDGQAADLTAPRLVLATGAIERPMPLPGWTLPGVMTAGAAQILLKQSGVLARRAVLVGSGPLLYLMAVQMIRAGHPPLALVETQTRADARRAWRHLPGALRGWRLLAKGAALLAEITRAGVPRHRGASDITIEGAAQAEAVRFVSGGRARRIACDTVLLHHGVIPNTQAARAMGVPHRWDAGQQGFAPVCDVWGETALPGLFIAGDGGGIAGAEAAVLSGRLAAWRIVEQAGGVSDAAEIRRLRLSLARARAPRAFLDAAYPPAAQALAPADAIVICRCEEVTAGQVRAHARLGCLGPAQAKVFSRVGMGPCQGRLCGPSVTAILSAAHGRDPDATGYFRIRPPIKPVTLGELASLDPEAPAPETL